MKNFTSNIFEVHWKVQFSGGGEGSEKDNRVEGLGKKNGSGVLEEGLIPQCTLWYIYIYTNYKYMYI